MKIDAGHDGVKSPVAAAVRRCAMSPLGQMRRMSCLGMSASPPAWDVWLRRSELALRVNSNKVHRSDIQQVPQRQMFTVFARYARGRQVFGARRGQ
jgi:hypothetical protein